MKAIIQLTTADSVHRAALALAQRVDAGELAPIADYHLSYQSASALFADITPARISLLDVLRQHGPCSVYALAKSAHRNYSNVHRDIAALEALRLVQRTDDGAVMVPFDTVEIHVSLQLAA